MVRLYILRPGSWGNVARLLSIISDVQISSRSHTYYNRCQQAALIWNDRSGVILLHHVTVKWVVLYAHRHARNHVSTGWSTSFFFRYRATLCRFPLTECNVLIVFLQLGLGLSLHIQKDNFVTASSLWCVERQNEICNCVILLNPVRNLIVIASSVLLICHHVIKYCILFISCWCRIHYKTIKNIHIPTINKDNYVIILDTYSASIFIRKNRASRVLCRVTCVLHYMFRDQ